MGTAETSLGEPPDSSTSELLSAFEDSAHALAGRLQAEHLDERDAWREVAEAGWTSILVPESLNGLGLDLRHLAAVHQALGRIPVDTPVIACGTLSAGLLSRLKGSASRDQLLSTLLSGNVIAATAWQEDTGQVVPDRARSVHCRFSNAGWLLNGTKRWVVGGSIVDGWLVDAVDDAGTAHLFWIPAVTPNTQLRAIEVIDSYSVHELSFHDAPVAEAIAVGDSVCEALCAALAIARIAQGAELIGLSRATFELTLEYLKTRVQFGRPIGANQALQHRMVDLYVRLEMASAGFDATISRQLAGEIDLEEAASRIKARAADVALLLTRAAVQLHGAIGITEEYRLGRYWKRALFLANWLGGPETHTLRHLDLHEERERRASATVRAPDDVRHLQDWEGADVVEFRRIVRSFLEQSYPGHIRNPPRRLRLAEVKEWYQTLARKGWLAPAWPKKYGGMGLPPQKLIALVEEFEDFGAARLPDQGIINVGPILIQYGTEEQRRRYLPKILSGEEIWCQGYSEPGAGSDLASLRTRAEPRGDHFLVNGQKIWTTLAHDATHMFMLARTSIEERKHDGISFLLVKLASPGVTVRPIRNIGGEEEFCEVFLDNVRVPLENVVGTLGEGWKIGMALLGFERLFVGSPKTSQYAMTQLWRLAKAKGLLQKPSFRSTYGRLLLDLLELKACFAGFAQVAGEGRDLPSNVSILKIWATETYTRISAELVRLADEDGLRLGMTRLDDGGEIAPLATLLNASVTTIYGGSNEIQRNILAKRVLGLPS